jgi:uncharacterized phage-associated protein
LELQKILYMAQMMHMGRNNGLRLVDVDFEAWDYGPVAPELYHKVKGYGSDAIEDVFYDARSFKEGDQRRVLLDEVCEALVGRRPGELVEITHWSRGAWAKNYVARARGVEIPDSDIRREYDERRSVKQ